VSSEALHIAVEQTRLRFPDVAFFDLSAAKRAICVRARDAVVDENEPSPAQKSTRACVRLVGTHAELVWSAPAAAESPLAVRAGGLGGPTAFWQKRSVSAVTVK
jgi:hypothetical protein